MNKTKKVFTVKMDYNNIKVELKSLARERGLRGYSRLRKSGLIDLIRNNPPPPVPQPTSSKYAKFKSYQLKSKRDKIGTFLEPPVEQTPSGPTTATRPSGVQPLGGVQVPAPVETQKSSNE